MKMKKHNLFIFIFIFAFVVALVPFKVYGKSCEVVSGTGNNLGDEIKCGSESFYVLSSNDKELKIITKYNLYVGDKIEKFESPDSTSDSTIVSNYCDSLKNTGKYKDVVLTTKYGDDDFYFCRAYSTLTYDKVLQNSIAKGLYPNGNMEVAYPLYGVVYMDDNHNDLYKIDNDKYKKDGVNYGEISDFADINYNNTKIGNYLNDYSKTLNTLGINVKNISLIGVDGLNDILSKINNKNVDLFENIPYDIDLYHDYELILSKRNLINENLISNNYKWIYGTSYWLGTSMKIYDEWFDFFMTTLGDFCQAGNACTVPNIGLGLRPVVTVDKNIVIDTNVINNPATYDNIMKFIIGGVVALIVVMGSVFLIIKNKKK